MPGGIRAFLFHEASHWNYFANIVSHSILIFRNNFMRLWLMGKRCSS